MSYLMHYGKGHKDGGHSGRYPWGSGERPKQRDIVIKKGQEFRTFTDTPRDNKRLKYTRIAPFDDEYARDNMREATYEPLSDWSRTQADYEVKIKPKVDAKIRNPIDVARDFIPIVKDKSYETSVNYLDEVGFFDMDFEERQAVLHNGANDFNQKHKTYDAKVYNAYWDVVEGWGEAYTGGPVKNESVQQIIKQYSKAGYDGFVDADLGFWTSERGVWANAPITILNADKFEIVDSAPNWWNVDASKDPNYETAYLRNKTKPKQN